MTKFESWPQWLQQLVIIPHMPILVWLMVTQPKTKRGWYFAYGFIAYMVVFYLLFWR